MHTQAFCLCHHLLAVCDQLLPDSQALILSPLSCWNTYSRRLGTKMHVLPRGVEKGDGAGRWVMWTVKKGAADLMAPNPRFLPLVKEQLLVTAAA